MSDELKITRRHLPHWTINDSVYFITFRAQTSVFDETEQRIILEHIKGGDGTYYDCYAAVVMPDHVHLLIRPKPGMTLSNIMHGIKGVSAHKINEHRATKGKVWQDESYDRIIRDRREFDEKLSYMLNNALKKGLTNDPWHYVGWYYNEQINR